MRRSRAKSEEEKTKRYIRAGGDVKKAKVQALKDFAQDHEWNGRVIWNHSQAMKALDGNVPPDIVKQIIAENTKKINPT